MATQLQLRKGTTTQNNAFTGAEAELVYDTDTTQLHIHNGTKQGGNIIDPIVEYIAPTAENNYTWARKYASGWVEQGGISNAVNGVGTTTMVTLPVVMADVNYSLYVTITRGAQVDYRDQFLAGGNRTTTGFTIYSNFAGGDGGTTNNFGQWQVSGIAA